MSLLDRTTPPHIGSLILMTGIAAMSVNIFLPSLANMAVFFDTDYAVVQLAVALYLIVNAGLQLALGPLSDRFGRRPLMIGAFVVFVLATVGCALSSRVEVFLAFRTVQSVAFAAVVLSRAVVRDMVPRNEAASMIGYVTMGMAVVPMVSPALGGFLDEAFGWQASFWLLSVLGCFAVWLAWADLGETHHHRSASFAAQVASHPELFRSPRFWGYALTGALAGGTYFSFLGGAPYVGSEVFGLTPVVLGVVFGSASFGYITGNFLSGRFSTRLGIAPMLMAGTVLMTAALGLSLVLLLTGLGGVWSFFGLMILVSAGNGMIIPNATSGFLSVRPHLAGTASGVGGAMMVGGGAAMVAWAGQFLDPVHGAEKLVALQFAAAAGSLATAQYTIRRERRLGAAASGPAVPFDDTVPGGP